MLHRSVSSKEHGPHWKRGFDTISTQAPLLMRISPTYQTRFLLAAILLACSVLPLPAQDSVGVSMPSFDSVPVQACKWPVEPPPEAGRTPNPLAPTSWILPLHLRPDEDSADTSPNVRRWYSPDSSSWLATARGSTRRFASGLGIWMYLVTRFHDESGDEFLHVGCNDCLQVEDSRCHEILQGHRFYAAWGRYYGPWRSPDYQALAAFELGPDDWLVIWGGGAAIQAREYALRVIRSVRYRHTE